MTPITMSLITVIGLGLCCLKYMFEWQIRNDSDKRKKQDDVDKRIDAISNADDVTRIGDELKDK